MRHLVDEREVDIAGHEPRTNALNLMRALVLAAGEHRRAHLLTKPKNSRGPNKTRPSTSISTLDARASYTANGSAINKGLFVSVSGQASHVNVLSFHEGPTGLLGG